MQPPSLFALLFGQRSSPLPPLAAVTPLYTNQPPGHEGATPAGVRESHTLNSGLPRCTGQLRGTMLVGVVVLLRLLLLFVVRRTPLPSHTPVIILNSVLPLRTPIRADSNSSRNPRHPRPPPPAAREEALSHEDSHALTTRPDRRASEREGGCSYSTSRPPEPGSQGERAGNHRRCRVRFEIVGKLRAAHVTEYRGDTVTNWGCSTSEPVRRMGTGDRLLDIPCKVCDDRSSGKHYGIYSCDGCSGFFKRSIHSKRKYTCKAHGAMTGHCPIDKIHRNQCRACRLNKCFHVGMNRDVEELIIAIDTPPVVPAIVSPASEPVAPVEPGAPPATVAEQDAAQGAMIIPATKKNSILSSDRAPFVSCVDQTLCTSRGHCAICSQCETCIGPVQHERGPRKPKLHSVMSDKLHHQQQQQPIVTQLSPHSGTTGHPDVSRVDFNSNLLSHHRSVVSQLSPLSGTTVHHDGPRVDISSHLLSHHRRLRCPQRTAPYPQAVSLMQKPPDESPSPVPIPLQFPPPNASLYHSATFAFGQQPPPLLQILMSAEKYQEFVWKSQPDGEGSLDQTETEASHSPTGILHSFIPTWEVLQETTARLLFMAVRWVRCLAPFQTLSKDDQLLLLQQTWTQLFLLHLAQWSITRDISGLLEDDQVRRRLPPEQSYRDEIVTIQEIMARFRQLSPDGGECGSMKAVILFTPETRGLSNPKPVEMLQDQAQCILGDYIRSRYPRQPARFGRFLLLLPSLQAVKPSTVELLFFRATIGEIPIARLLGDMYQMEHHHADVTLSFCNRFQESSEHERDLQSEKDRG